jgi:anti-sigma B factor antagonist
LKAVPGAVKWVYNRGVMPPKDLDELTIESETTPEGFRVIRLKGWITAKNTPSLQTAIEQARGFNTILDLSGVPYMDSSGLGALLQGYVGCQKYGGQFVLAALVPRVLDLLQLTKVESLFRIYKTPQDAVTALAKGASA